MKSRFMFQPDLREPCWPLLEAYWVDVPCLTCGAIPGVSCRTSGERRSPTTHTARRDLSGLPTVSEAFRRYVAQLPEWSRLGLAHWEVTVHPRLWTRCMFRSRHGRTVDGLDVHALAVAVWLSQQTHAAIALVADVATWLSSTDRKVEASLDALEAAGWIHCLERGAGRFEYRLALPEQVGLL